MSRYEGKPAVAHDVDGVVEGEFDDMGGGDALATVRTGGGAMQRIQTQYMTAVSVQKARDLATVEKRVLQEAGIAGEDFIYSMTFKSAGGPSVIEGVSIDGAMILARNFMNCASDVEVVEDAPGHWVFRATFVDLETGFTETRLFRQRKSQRSMKGDPERALDIAFQIGQSKAKRNVITRAMPTWLVSHAIAAAKASAEAKIKDLPAAIENAIKTFAEMTVSQERLERKIGARASEWNARDIVRLKSTYKAIRDRQTSTENEFPSVEEVPNAQVVSTQAASTETPATPAATAQPVPTAAPASTVQPSAVAAVATVPVTVPAAMPTTTEATKEASPPPAAAPSEPAKAKKDKRDREPGED